MSAVVQEFAPPAPARLPQTWRDVAWVAALTACVSAIWVFGGVHSSFWVPASLGVFAIVGAILVAAAARGWPLPLPLIAAPMAAFGLVILLQFGLGWSESPSDTLTGLVQLASAGAVFYLAYLGFNRKRRLVQTATVLWWTSGALAAEAIAQYFTSNQRIYWIRDASYASPTGPFYYHNHFAGCMDLLIPVAIAYAFSGGRKGEADWVGWLRRGIFPALGVTAVALANSRGGILSLGFEAAIAVPFCWAHLNKRWVGIVAAILVLATGPLLTTAWQPLMTRFQNLAARDPSATVRLDALAGCWRMFRDHPWVGTGFESFAAVYPRYQTVDTGLLVNQAHDEYAQALAETGLAGMLAVVGFLAIYFVRGWRLRRGEWTRSRRAQVGALIGTLGFLFHSAIDFQFHAPANLWLFFLLVAVTLASTASPSSAAASRPPLQHNSAPESA